MGEKKQKWKNLGKAIGFMIAGALGINVVPIPVGSSPPTLPPDSDGYCIIRIGHQYEVEDGSTLEISEGRRGVKRVILTPEGN